MKVPTPLRAITLHPWWAFAITHGEKRVEYRSRPLPRGLIGVPVALHAGASTPADRRGKSKATAEAMDLGAPIDEWIFWGCPSSAFVALVTFTGNERACGAFWGNRGLVGWRIGDCPTGEERRAGVRNGVRVLPQAVPASGKQGWWTCTEEQRAAIVSQRSPLGGRLPRVDGANCVPLEEEDCRP